MKLILTTEEKTDLLTTCLQYFWQSLSMWEHEAHYTDKQYLRSKQMIIEKKGVDTICQEDVLAHIILNGAGINIVDCEDEENKVCFNLAKFDENFDKCDPAEVIPILVGSSDYDFENTDNVLQTLIFGSVIYG